MAMTSTTKLSLAEAAVLYKVAWAQKCEGDQALARVRDCMARHNFAEAEVRREAGILPHEPTPNPPRQ